MAKYWSQHENWRTRWCPNARRTCWTRSGRWLGEDSLLGHAVPRRV